MTPCLNWRELELLTQKINLEIEGLFVDRMIVPERPSFPEKYLKGEWAIRLTGRKQEGVLLISIRARHPYISWLPGKGPKASTLATRSPFDLNVSKQLKGAKLLLCESLARERVMILWFSEEGQANSRLGLVLALIPAAPEAFFVRAQKASNGSIGNPENGPWPILCRSRTIRNESKNLKSYSPPDGANAPNDPVIRDELIRDAESLHKVIEQELRLEAFESRVLLAHKSMRHLLKHTQERLRQSQTALSEGKKELDWQRLGDLLKGSLGNPAPLEGTVRYVCDFMADPSGEGTASPKIAIPCDPRLSLNEQVEKFYQNARRKQRRIQEAQSRMDRFKETCTRLERALQEKLTPLDWPSLEKLETAAGTSLLQGDLTPSERKAEKKRATWLGKFFTSKNRLTIWVGRSKDENLDLTFKHARGNDLWLHVRGRPGAHVVIPLQTNKSAPLDTLIDAAHLAIYYSGGEKWGKTEVDYTYKKYVKRIKDSSEASYTHNKTLLIEPDSARIKRLLSQPNE